MIGYIEEIRYKFKLLTIILFAMQLICGLYEIFFKSCKVITDILSYSRFAKSTVHEVEISLSLDTRYIKLSTLSSVYFTNSVSATLFGVAQPVVLIS